MAAAKSRKSKEEDNQKKKKNKISSKKEVRIRKPEKSDNHKKKKVTSSNTSNSKSKAKKPNPKSSANRKINGERKISDGAVKDKDEAIYLDTDSSCGSRQSGGGKSKMATKDGKKNARKEKIEEINLVGDEEERACVFPMARVKRIIKGQGIDSSLSQDAVFLVNKASEMFIQLFSEDAYNCSIQDRKKSLHYDHLSSVVLKQKRYDFLSDFVPEKVKAEDALAEWKSAEAGSG